MSFSKVSKLLKATSSATNRRNVTSNRRLLMEQQRRLLFQDLYKAQKLYDLRSYNGQSNMQPNYTHSYSPAINKTSAMPLSFASHSMIQTRGIGSFFSPFSSTSEKEENKEIEGSKIGDGQLEKNQPQETAGENDGYDDAAFSNGSSSTVAEENLAERGGGFTPLSDCVDDEVLKIVRIPLGKLEENTTWSSIDEIFAKLIAKEGFFEAFHLVDRLCQELKHYQESSNENDNKNEWIAMIGAILHRIIEEWSISDKHIRKGERSPSPSNIWIKISEDYHPLGIPISTAVLDEVMKRTLYFQWSRRRDANGPKLVDDMLKTMMTDPTLKPTIHSFNAAMSSWEAYAKDKYFKMQTENVSIASKRLLELLGQARIECGEYGVLPNRDAYKMVMRVLAYQGDGDKVEELLEQLYGVYLDAIKNNNGSDDNINDYCPTTECFSLVLFAWSQSDDKSGAAAERASEILETMLELEANKELLGLEVTARCFDIVLKCWSQVDIKSPIRNKKMQEFYDRMVELSKTDHTKTPTNETDQIMRLSTQLNNEVTTAATDRRLFPVGDKGEGRNNCTSRRTRDLRRRQEVEVLDFTVVSPMKSKDVFVDPTEDISVVDDTKELTPAELQFSLEKRREYVANAIENNLIDADKESPLQTLYRHLGKARAKVEYITTIPGTIYSYHTRITYMQGNITIKADGTGETDRRSRSAAALILLNKLRDNEMLKELENETPVAGGPWQQGEDSSVGMAADMDGSYSMEFDSSEQAIVRFGHAESTSRSARIFKKANDLLFDEANCRALPLQALHNICVNLMNGKLDYNDMTSKIEYVKTEATYTQGATTIVVEGTGESKQEAKNDAALQILYKLRDILRARKNGIEETAAADTVA